MFKSVYYDEYNNKMHLWEIKDGKTTHEVIDHQIAYYIEDKTKTSETKDIYGTHVNKMFTDNKKNLKDLKLAYGKLFESDLSEEVKFLHERYKDQKDEIDYQQYKVANIDIEIQGENEFPKPELAKYPINLITIDDYRNDKITTFGLQPYTGEAKTSNYIYCETEELLLQSFIQFMRKEKFSVSTGWFSDNFDWPYIINRCKNLEIDYTKISPIGKVKCNQKKDGSWKVEIAGLYILDGMALYKKFSYQNQPSYNLNYIGMQEVNDGKLDYDGQINDLWKRDWNLFVDYNVQDCLLVRKIEYKRKFVDLAINLGVQTRIPLDKVYSTVAVVEGYIIRYLHRENMVMSDRVKEVNEDEETIEGGYVESHPGFYNNMLSIDATSEYPSLIRMINISPETKVMNPSPEEIKDLIKGHSEGLYYKKEQGVIPKIVTDIFSERKRFKTLMEEAQESGNKELESYYDSQQLIRKILINSIYGTFCSEYYHYFDLDNAAEITRGGRTVIQYVAKCIDDYFSKEFYKISKKFYPNSNLVQGDIPEKSVKVIDTDSILGDSIINTSIGNMKIEDLYTMFKCNSKETSKDNFTSKVNNIQSLSFSNKFNLEYKNIEYIKKHKVSKRMFKVKVGGNEVVVTEDHSLVVNRNGLLISCSPKDIRKGDKIIKIC